MKRILALAVLLLCSRAVHAQGAAYTAGPFNVSGLFYVCPVPSGGNPCPSPSTIFTTVALITPLSNPILIPQGQTVSFFVTPGQYIVQMPAASYSQIVTIGGGSSPVPGTFNSNFDPPLFQNYSLTTTGPQSAINETVAPIDVHILQWRPSGTVTTCTIALDTSPDGVTWTAGGAIAGQTCTSAGEFSSPQSITANFVRVNLTALTGGGTIAVIYSGRLAPTPASNGGVSNGQWVNANEVIWTQITQQGIGTVSVSTDIRITTPGGSTTTVDQTVSSCALSSNGGFGYGYTVPLSGWLQSVTTQVNTGGFPQGTFYIQHFIMANMPSGGTSNSCTGSFSSYAGSPPAMLDSNVVGSTAPIGFLGTTSIQASPWSIPGYTLVVPVSQPAAGAEWTYSVPTNGGTGARMCLQGAFFQLATSATVATRIVSLRLLFNGSTFTPQLLYPATTNATASQTEQYSFAPATTNNSWVNAGTIFQTVPMGAQNVCFNSGSTIVTPKIGSVTANLQAADQYSAIGLIFTVQQDNN